MMEPMGRVVIWVLIALSRVILNTALLIASLSSTATRANFPSAGGK